MLLLHLAALFFVQVALFVTVPLHLILLAGQRRPPAPVGVDVPTPDTHVRCPDCRELVRMDARKCKHCGITLVPQK